VQKLSAHRTTIYWILVVLIFFIPSVSGCGGSGGGFDNSTGFRGTERSGTSNGKALTPNVSSTPSNPIFAPGVNHTSSSPTKTLKTSSIPLPAGSTITIKSFSGDAAASNMFGYYDPVTGTEEVLTADCLASVQAGEVFGPFGPYENDVTVVFWFYSTWTSSPGKMMVEAVDSATYNIGCEDWDDDDYNDYIAQVTIEPPSKISIKNAKATPEKFNPSFNPPDNVSIITASIVAKEGFSAETISWNVVINNNNGLVKSFTDRTGSPGVGPWNVSEVWDGKNDSGVFAGAGEYTFKITATATANGETVQKSASGKVTIVDNKLKIIDASIVPSYASPGQTIILNYKVVTYPELWEPPLRSCYYILNTSNYILVTADLQPTSYASCTAEYKDVHVTIPASAEIGAYKVQITAWTYAVIDSNGRPLSAEPVELALNIGAVSNLSIENAKATPKEFVPPGTTTITATITAKDFTPVDLNWTLTIKNDKTDATVHTSKGATTQISVPWELSKVKNFPGYGNYTFNIKATCKDGAGNSYEAEVSEAIKVKPPVPKITLIKFVKPIHMVDENGEKIETVYYSEKDGAVKQNPIAFAWSEIGAASDTASSQTASKDASDSSKDTTMKMTFQLEKAPLEPITYKFRSVSAEQGEIILKDYSVAFEKHKTEKESDITIVAPQMVNYVDDLKWQYSSESEDGGTPTYNDLVQTQEPICVALASVTPTFKGKTRAVLQKIACKISSGAKTPDEIRKKMVGGVWDYLNNINYKYNWALPHCTFIKHSNQNGIYLIEFNYSQFKSDMGGDCEDFSCLYQVCCQLAGTEMFIEQFLNGLYKPPPGKWDDIHLNPVYWIGQSYPHIDNSMVVEKLHQVGSFEGKIYDPTFKLEIGFFTGFFKTDYVNLLVKPLEIPQVKWTDKIYQVSEIK